MFDLSPLCAPKRTRARQMQPRRSLADLLVLSATLAVRGAAFADDVIGQASVIDGNTIESTAPEFSYSGWTRLSRINFVATRRAIAAVRKHRTRCSILLPGVPLNALRLTGTDTTARWLFAPLGARTLLIGL
jgi:hypothetical protein